MHRRWFARLAAIGGALGLAKPRAHAADQPPGQVWAMRDLIGKQGASGRPYLPFLKVPALHCGMYALSAGAEDKQQPHREDEVYYVEAGRGKIVVDGVGHDVKTGDVVYVAAEAEHRFHSIEEDLKLLVFFSSAPPKG